MANTLPTESKPIKSTEKVNETASKKDASDKANKNLNKLNISEKKRIQEKQLTQKLEDEVNDELQEMLDEVKHDQHQKKDDILMYVSVGLSTLIIIIVSIFAFFGWQHIQTIESKLTNRVEVLENEAQINSQSIADLETSLKNTIPNFQIEKTRAQIQQPSPSERWLGSKDAQYVWIVYSDFDCPFCKQIWPNLEKLPSDQKNVAVVFRHLPIAQLHPNAEKVALASECVADVDGNEAFFKFVRGYKIEQKITAELSNISNYVSNTESFKSCINSGKTAVKVDRDKTEAAREGINGTPTSVLYNLKTGETKTVRGAVPYSQMISELKSFQK